jgi:transcriptional regulator
MAKKFGELREKMSVEALAESALKAAELSQEIRVKREMTLGELRKARNTSQEKIATRLHKRQSSISRIEKRTDMYISTLRNAVEAMGGELKIVARFPDGDEIAIKQFREIDNIKA